MSRLLPLLALLAALIGATPAQASGQLPYDPRARQAADQLGVRPELVNGVIDGLELLYQRKYKECRALFGAVNQAFPGSAVAPVGDVLVWQAVMLENFEFRYDDQYRAASALARKELDAALKQPGNDAWEHLMYTVVAGIEAIHAARQSRYLPALSLAFEAVDHIEKTRALAPRFVDLRLADGLYNYWRTVVTRRTRGMPDFGDRRAEGIAQMQEVADRGVFLRPPARLALAFSFLEEREYPKAIAALEENQRLYPDNVINELMLGVARLQAKDYAGARAAFDRVLQIDPQSRRVRYFRGVLLLRTGEPAAAEAELRAYLGFDHLEKYQRSAASYRLGDALYAQKRYADAWAAYQAAVKADGHSGAKAALKRMEKLRKEGVIAW